MFASAFLSLPFRPFFLLAGLFATLWLPLWLLVWRGTLPLAANLGPVGWHRHEMLFGYTLAVIAGFLLTAVWNWTGQPPNRAARDGGLFALALLWAVPRLGLPVSALLPLWAQWGLAGIDVAFPLAVAAALYSALRGSGLRRNLGFVPLLGLLAAANAAVHLEALGVLAPDAAAGGTRAALDTIVLIMVVMGGRVIPFFTGNALPEAGVRRVPAAERASVVLVAAMLLADLAPIPPAVPAVCALLGSAASAWRMAGWRGLATRSRPILWVLHLAYGWIVVGLALKGLSAFIPALPSPLATHALTVGAIGGLTLGMMSRVALGHTGRPLHVAPPIALAYALVHLAAVVRVAAPLAVPNLYFAGLVVSGSLWSAAFALFTAIYWPILTRPRAQGRPA